VYFTARRHYIPNQHKSEPSHLQYFPSSKKRNLLSPQHSLYAYSSPNMPHFITVERDELTRIEFIFATYLTEIEPCSNRPYEVYRARAAAMLEGHAFPLRVEEGSSMYNQIVEMRGLEAALRNRYYHGRVGENRNANEIEEQPNAHGPASLSGEWRRRGLVI
jgi:hypothetical protein